MSLLSSLRDQLFILAGVEHDLEAELVPALFGDGVEKKASLNGFCCHLFSNKQDLKERLDYIRDLFHQTIDHLNKSCILHFNLWQYERENKPFDTIAKTKAEDRILQTCTYLNPFIKQFLRGHDLPYLKFLSEGKDFLFFLIYAKIVQKTKNLEMTTGVSVPFHVLRKLHVGFKLNANENDLIDEWLQALENSKSTRVASFKGDKQNPYVSGRWLHRYFTFLSRVLLWNATNLEIELAKRGCMLFDEPDPYWIKGRKKVRQGHSFCIEGKDYIVDSCIQNADNDPALPMVFSIQDNPRFNLVIDRNESCSNIQVQLHKQMHYGVIMPQVSGRFMAISLVERTYHPLSSIIWQSNDDNLLDSDVIQMHPIIGLLDGLCLQPCTPIGLSPAAFAFNIDDDMRALQLMPKGDFMSFEALEDFVWACSLNADRSINSAVFTYLMTSSQLVHLPHVKLYQDLIKQAYEEQEIEKAISLNGIDKKADILDCRREFFLSIQAFKQEIIQEILTHYQVIDVKKLHERLVSVFQAIHLKRCPGRFFLPGFSQQCKHEVLLDLKPRMALKYLGPIRKALIDQISRCKLGDPAVQSEWKEEKKYHLYGIYNKSERDEIYYQGKIINTGNKTM